MEYVNALPEKYRHEFIKLASSSHNSNRQHIHVAGSQSKTSNETEKNTLTSSSHNSNHQHKSINTYFGPTQIYQYVFWANTNLSIRILGQHKSINTYFGPTQIYQYGVWANTNLSIRILGQHKSINTYFGPT